MRPFLLFFLILFSTSSTAIDGDEYACWLIGGEVAKDAPHKFCEFLAEKGDHNAMFTLGLIYYHGVKNSGTDGFFIDVDYELAFKWFSEAADEGIKEAEFKIGKMYANGEGVSENNKLAFIWFKKAAEKGHVESQRQLGNRYYSGLGVLKDLVLSSYWHLKAADQGSAKSQCAIGINYQLGKGISKDFIQAHKWLNLCAASGDKFAIELRNALESLMTQEQIDSAQKLASDWYHSRE